MKKTALIMAGGRGERFWPKSRQQLPKQFLSLTDDNKTMIQLTVERILPLVAMEDIYIATNQDYKALVREQLPDLPEQNILCEPVGRNTAPCIGLGAVHIARKYEDALMFVLPSDHLIKMNTIFLRTLRDACEVAEQGDNLVTIGITPDTPETGYGYIRFDADRTLGRAFAVEQFVEKPSLDKAKEYLASGQYMWNSGMFTWKVSTILKNIRQKNFFCNCSMTCSHFKIIIWVDKCIAILLSHLNCYIKSLIKIVTAKYNFYSIAFCLVYFNKRCCIRHYYYCLCSKFFCCISNALGMVT